MVGRLLKSFFLIIFVDFNDGIPVSFLKKKFKKRENSQNFSFHHHQAGVDRGRNLERYTMFGYPNYVKFKKIFFQYCYSFKTKRRYGAQLILIY